MLVLDTNASKVDDDDKVAEDFVWEKDALSVTVNEHVFVRYNEGERVDNLEVVGDSVAVENVIVEDASIECVIE